MHSSKVSCKEMEVGEEERLPMEVYERLVNSH